MRCCVRFRLPSRSFAPPRGRRASRTLSPYILANLEKSLHRGLQSRLRINGISSGRTQLKDRCLRNESRMNTDCRFRMREALICQNFLRAPGYDLALNDWYLVPNASLTV